MEIGINAAKAVYIEALEKQEELLETSAELIGQANCSTLVNKVYDTLNVFLDEGFKKAMEELKDEDAVGLRESLCALILETFQEPIEKELDLIKTELEDAKH